MMRKRKFLIIAICVWFAAFAVFFPFAVNHMMNMQAKCDQSEEIDALTELLSASLFPEIMQSALRVKPTKKMNFGKFHLIYTYLGYGSFSKPQIVSDTVKNNKAENRYFKEVVWDRYHKRAELFQNNDGFHWEDLNDSETYRVYFKLNETKLYEQEYEKEVAAYYSDGKGNSLLKWVGCQIGENDLIWGIPVEYRYLYSQGLSGFYTLFSELERETDTVEYLAQIGLFAGLQEWNFGEWKSVARRDTQVVGFLFYGKGSDIKQYREDARITPVKMIGG